MNIKCSENFLQELFNKDETNKMFADFLLTYIENADKIANRNLYDSIIDYFSLDKNTIKILNQDYNFKNNLIELDVNQYSNNPYNKNIKLNDVTYKNYKFENKCYKAYEGFLIDDVYIDYLSEHTKIGYFNSNYNYISLSVDDNIWMLITPHEINTMKNYVDKAYGNVITFGLGLGYYAYMCSLKDEVKTVTIIEKDEKIIELFNKFILPLFENKDKIKIINCDALNYLKEKDFNYDYGFIDLYRDVNDGIKLYIDTYKLSLNHPNTTFDFWIEKSMLVMIRRCLITVIYETYYNINCNEHNNYFDYIINRFKVILKDYNISCKKDVLDLLNLDNIKTLIKQI